LITVKTVDAVENRRRFRGRLLGISGNQIEMESDGGVLQIPISKVAKANLEIDWDVLPKK
jgi:ribosome maturation factor RimP